MTPPTLEPFRVIAVNGGYVDITPRNETSFDVAFYDAQGLRLHELAQDMGTMLGVIHDSEANGLKYHAAAWKRELDQAISELRFSETWLEEIDTITEYARKMKGARALYDAMVEYTNYRDHSGEVRRPDEGKGLTD